MVSSTFSTNVTEMYCLACPLGDRREEIHSLLALKVEKAAWTLHGCDLACELGSFAGFPDLLFQYSHSLRKRLVVEF